MQWLPEAIVAAVALYTPILEAAERTVNLAKTMKNLLGIGADQKLADEMRQTLSERNSEQNKAQIDKQVAQIKSPLDEPRLTEIKTQINIYSIKIVNEVAQGARISTGTGRNVGDLPDYIDIGGEPHNVLQLLQQQKIIEDRLKFLIEGSRAEIERIENRRTEEE